MYAARRIAAPLVASLAVASLALLGGAVAAVDASADGTETTLQYDGDEVTLRPQSGQTLAGETSLEPGSEVRIRVSTAGEDPLLRTDPAEVNDDGTFEATFDLSDVDPDTPVTVQVRHDGETLLETDGRVVEEESGDAAIEGTETDASQSSADGAGFGAGVAVVAVAAVAGAAAAVRSRR